MLGVDILDMTHFLKENQGDILLTRVPYTPADSKDENLKMCLLAMLHALEENREISIGGTASCDGYLILLRDPDGTLDFDSAAQMVMRGEIPPQFQVIPKEVK